MAIELVEMALGLAMELGVNVARYNSMKEANGGGPLTSEQRAELAHEAQESIDRLPD